MDPAPPSELGGLGHRTCHTGHHMLGMVRTAACALSLQEIQCTALRTLLW